VQDFFHQPYHHPQRMPGIWGSPAAMYRDKACCWRFSSGGWVKESPKAAINGMVEYVQYMYLEPQWPSFLKVNPQNKTFSNQNKGHLGSR